MSWSGLDEQMLFFAQQLETEVRIKSDKVQHLATSIATEIGCLSDFDKDLIRAASPVPLEDRLVELKSFQKWMEQACAVQGNMVLTRAQLLSQNYICFVYLPESCFKVLAKVCPSGSVVKKCAQYLSSNPIRAYRNAIAHSNWTYRKDFGAIVYWAKKGSEENEPLVRFEVEQTDLNFWQALSRCVAYAAFSSL